MLGLIFLLLIGKGWLFRQAVSYRGVGTRSVKALSSSEGRSLIRYISEEAENPQALIRKALKATNRQLKFSAANTSSHPDQVLKRGKAHCVGYAALFASLTQAGLDQQVPGRFLVKHRIGKLALFGYDLHQLIQHPFFKDHDFCEIYDRELKAYTYIDPSLSDYFGISRVSGVEK